MTTELDWAARLLDEISHLPLGRDCPPQVDLLLAGLPDILALARRGQEAERIEAERDDLRRAILWPELTRTASHAVAVARAAEACTTTINIPTTRFMDQPDGGDVPIAEQVSRMYAALLAAEARVAELEISLADELREHGEDEEAWEHDSIQDRNRAAAAEGRAYALQSENEKLRAALKHYACEDGCGGADCGRDVESMACGRVAAEALSRTP